MRNEISLYTPPTVRAEHGRSPLFVSRRECAVLLFPTSSVKGAVAAMHRWIEGDEQLRKALQDRLSAAHEVVEPPCGGGAEAIHLTHDMRGL